VTDIFYTLVHLQGNQDWQPPVNMFESDEEFWIEVELAGMEKDQIKVVFEDGVLSISGTRKRCSRTGMSSLFCILQCEKSNIKVPEEVFDNETRALSRNVRSNHQRARGYRRTRRAAVRDAHRGRGRQL